MVTPLVTSIKGVFQSGTKEELLLKAKLVGLDEDRDIAFLSVKNWALPKIVDSTADSQLYETASFLVFGFPFRGSLSSSKRNPGISVSKCSISSIRRDDNIDGALIQIDGAINPGNSGGPVITKTGQLVGIAVAKVMGANIGLPVQSC